MGASQLCFRSFRDLLRDNTSSIVITCLEGTEVLVSKCTRNEMKRVQYLLLLYIGIILIETLKQFLEFPLRYSKGSEHNILITSKIHRELSAFVSISYFLLFI